MTDSEKFDTLEALRSWLVDPTTGEPLSDEATVTLDALLVRQAVRMVEDAFADGFEAALRMIETSRAHYSWGPNATPDDGVRANREGTIRALAGQLAVYRNRL